MHDLFGPRLGLVVTIGLVVLAPHRKPIVGILGGPAVGLFLSFEPCVGLHEKFAVFFIPCHGVKPSQQGCDVAVEVAGID